MTKTNFEPNKEFTYIDTIDGYDINDEWRNIFKEYKEDDGYTVKDDKAYDEDGNVVDSIEEFIEEQERIDVEDFFESLKFSRKITEKYGYLRCVVTGQFNSRYPDFYGPNPLIMRVNPVESLYKAFDKCLHDAEWFSVKVKDDVIYITTIHHDGTNTYEIRLVTEDAYDAIEYEEVTDEEFMNNKNNFLPLYCEIFNA